VEIDTDKDLPGTMGFALRVELNEMTGKSTVPAVFINDKYIGGFTDGIARLEEEGKLIDMLEETGAL